MVDIITRTEARASGLTRYFTGQPCRHGHVSERSVSDGRCVACKNAYHWAWEQAHPEAVARYKAAPTWLESRAETVERYNAKPETRAKHAARYRDKREDILAYVAQYTTENPEKARQHKRNYKARKKGADGSHTAEQVAALLLEQGHRCANSVCGASLQDGYHADHVIALVNGGSNDIANIQLLCPTCNHRKNRKTPEQWALDRLITE